MLKGKYVRTEYHRNLIRERCSGEKCNLWKGGVWKNKTNAEYLRERRHRLGISKKFIVKYGGQRVSSTHYKIKYKKLKRIAGPLTIQTIQQVYEDNIKEFRTLTCIYCFEHIVFGNDSLEHIIPLSRGGTNKYNNLAIACRFCNRSKKDKLLEEWIL